jgi:hypothetical protein
LPGQRRELAVELRQRAPLRQVPAQRPGGDRQDDLDGTAGEHEQTDVHRHAGALGLVPQHEGRRRGGHPHLRTARPHREQQTGQEAEHEQQQRGRDIAAGQRDGQGARDGGGQGGGRHAQHAQPVRPGAVGQGGLQGADRRRQPERGAAGEGADGQRQRHPEGIAQRDNRIGLGAVQPRGVAQQLDEGTRRSRAARRFQRVRHDLEG